MFPRDQIPIMRLWQGSHRSEATCHSLLVPSRQVAHSGPFVTLVASLLCSLDEGGACQLLAGEVALLFVTDEYFVGW